MYLTKKLTPILLNFAVFTAAYGQGSVVIDSTMVKKLRIDPITAIGVPAGEIFSKVEYIPLETSEQSLFGTVNNLQVVDGKLIFYDMDTWSILIFNNKGKFINRLTSKNIAGSAELPAGTSDGNVFRTFNIVKEKNKAHIEIISNKFLLKYDLDGKFIEKIKSQPKTLTYMLKNFSKIVPYYSEDQNTYYEFALLKKDKTERYFPFSLSKFGQDDFYTQGSRFFPAPDNYSVTFIDYYSYDALDISENGVFLKYRFIFPQSLSMPEDFAVNPIYKAKKWDYIKSHKQMIYGIHNVVKIRDYLYFSLAQYSQQISDKKALAYHLPSGKLLSLQHVIPDASTYFLPTNDATYGSNFMMKGFLNYDETSLYTVISSLSMFKFDSENKVGKTFYPAHLKEYFKGSSKNNAVIVKITPR